MLATLFFVLIIGYLEKNMKVESFQDDEIDEAWQLEFSRPANEGHMDAVQMKVSEKMYIYLITIIHFQFSV